MKITTVRTEKVDNNSNLFKILDKTILRMGEESILVVTSKIVALCEGSSVSTQDRAKNELIEQEADYYLPASKSKYNVTLTLKNNILTPSAGIDESNANGRYVLWPKNAQQSANAIREYLCQRFGQTKLGVIITDSKTTPLRWGTTGIALAHSGFLALNSYIGKPDIFKRMLKMTKSNIRDGLAAAAVVVMGEGNEQTPLAVIEDIPFCQFQERNPTMQEIQELVIAPEDDIYAPILQKVEWKRKNDTKKSGQLTGFST